MTVDIQSLKRELRKTGVKAKNSDLLALSPQNDPYGVFTDGRKEMGKWAYEVWESMDRPTFHIRRMHYWIVSSEVKKPNGKLYENTEKDWNYLANAVKYARYLGLIPVDVLEDRRNPDPIINVEYRKDECWIGDIDLSLSPEVELSTDGIYGDIHEFADAVAKQAVSNSLINFHTENAQPYHLEVWCEKSTMNDVLTPVCGRYCANLVTGLGQMSLTQCYHLIKRTCIAGKPVRILYISDFDPAGTSMPRATARKIEWCIDHLDVSVDVRLKPIALTQNQCVRYQLPRTPIKDSDKAKSSFEKKYGEGATELDALEALHPGELGRLVADALDPFYDPDIGEELLSFEESLKSEIYNTVYDAIIEQAGEEIDELFAEIQADVERIQKVIEPFLVTLQAKVEKLNSLLSDFYIDINVDTQPPRSRLLALEDECWLFDSRRDYLTQLSWYEGEVI